MSRPPMKALESIQKYCLKTQCRRCVFGETDYSSDDIDYIGCKLQMNNPCDWILNMKKDDNVIHVTGSEE